MDELLATLDPGKAALVRRYVKTLRPPAGESETNGDTLAPSYRHSADSSSDTSGSKDSLNSVSLATAGADSGRRRHGQCLEFLYWRVRLGTCQTRPSVLRSFPSRQHLSRNGVSGPHSKHLELHY